MSDEEINKIICLNIDKVDIPNELYNAIIFMRDRFFQEKEKNKKLEIELEIKKYCKVDELTRDLIYYKNLAKEYQGNCISKEKIRDLIAERKFELQQEYEDFENDIKLKILEELLGD